MHQLPHQPQCCLWPLTLDDGNKQWDGSDCQQFSASHPVLTQCNPLLPLSLLLSDHLKLMVCSSQSLVFGHHESDKTWHSQMSNGPNKLLISSVPISAASKEVYHNTQSFPVKTCQKWSHNLQLILIHKANKYLKSGSFNDSCPEPLLCDTLFCISVWISKI